MLNRSGIRLIVLDSCESGRLAIDPFRSIAPALMRAQVPAVVAMQFPVQQDAARFFAVEFYRALVEGFPIDACLTEGRKAVLFNTGIDNANWGIPVAYTRAADGKLFDLPAIPVEIAPNRDNSPPSPTNLHEPNPEGQEQALHQRKEPLAGDQSIEMIKPEISGTNRIAETSTADRSEHMESGTNSQSIGPTALRDFLVAHFNDNDLRDLCFEMGIEDEDVPGDTRSAKAREIVRYCQRHTRTEDLKAACAQLRPKQWAAAFPGAAPSAGPSATPVQAPAEAVQDDDLTIQRETLRAQLTDLKRRLGKLQIQAARKGTNVDPEIAMDIEDLEGRRDWKGNLLREGEIAKLERQLKDLGG